MTKCIHCDEDVSERAHGSTDQGRFHQECGIRMFIGSAGHLLGLCSCHGGLDKMEDPPGWEPRASARLAMFVWQAQRAGEAGAIEALRSIFGSLPSRGSPPPRTLH